MVIKDNALITGQTDKKLYSITMYKIKWPTPSEDSLPKFATLNEPTVPTNLKGIDFFGQEINFNGAILY